MENFLASFGEMLGVDGQILTTAAPGGPFEVTVQVHVTTSPLTSTSCCLVVSYAFACQN